VTANFLETFFYFALPVFFMITGATLMEYRKRYDTKVFLKKRFEKTFIPYIAWSLFAMVFGVVYLNKQADWNVLHIIDNIFNARYWKICWFFPALFAIYLSLPILMRLKIS